MTIQPDVAKQLILTPAPIPPAYIPAPFIQPNIETPLIPNPNQPLPTNTIDPATQKFQPAENGANFDLGYLQAFIGTWNSPKGAAATGYNVMSLPQTDAPDGYVTKNFPYYEEMTFAPIAGNAPNRTGDGTLNCNVLFYGQRVFIASNANGAPDTGASVQDTLIHAENGAWLHFAPSAQFEGPYGPGIVPPAAGGIPVVSPQQEYVKQITIPHGNSLLLVGGATLGTGRPTDFPVADRTQLPFSGDPSIPDPTMFLNTQLDTLAGLGLTVTSYIKIALTTQATGGGLVNIPFGNSPNATVLSQATVFYIETLSNGAVQLQYSQLITMSLLVKGVKKTFLHIDANTLLPAV